MYTKDKTSCFFFLMGSENTVHLFNNSSSLTAKADLGDWMSKVSLNTCYHIGQKQNKKNACVSIASFSSQYYQDFISTQGLHCQHLIPSHFPPKVVVRNKWDNVCSDPLRPVKCHTHAGQV